MSFYTRCKEAEHAGFRPCKRCKPDVLGGMPEERAVMKVRSLVEQNLNKFTIGHDGQVENDAERTEDLAQKVQVSKWHFHRIFKEVTGTTPAAYVKEQSSVTLNYSMTEEEMWAGICKVTGTISK